MLSKEKRKHESKKKGIKDCLLHQQRMDTKQHHKEVHPTSHKVPLHLSRVHRAPRTTNNSICTTKGVQEGAVQRGSKPPFRRSNCTSSTVRGMKERVEKGTFGMAPPLNAPFSPCGGELAGDKRLKSRRATNGRQPKWLMPIKTKKQTWKFLVPASLLSPLIAPVLPRCVFLLGSGLFCCKKHTNRCSVLVFKVDLVKGFEVLHLCTNS